MPWITELMLVKNPYSLVSNFVCLLRYEIGISVVIRKFSENCCSFHQRPAGNCETIDPAYRSTAREYHKHSDADRTCVPIYFFGEPIKATQSEIREYNKVKQTTNI